MVSKIRGPAGPSFGLLGLGFRVLGLLAFRAHMSGHLVCPHTSSGSTLSLRQPTVGQPHSIVTRNGGITDILTTKVVVTITTTISYWFLVGNKGMQSDVIPILFP